MRLTALKVHNFMPYYGEQEIVFPVDEKRNVMLVFGSNMRGKTSLLNAIRWCFYGKAVDRQNAPIGRVQLINRDAADADEWRMAVFVSFEANGKSYDLRRTLEVRELVAEPHRDEDFLEDLSLRRNGNVLVGDDIEHELNQVMPEQIARFFLFDAELLSEYEALLIEDSEQGKLIKDAIEQVLGVPALINGRNEVRTLLKKAQATLARENKHSEGMRAQAEQFDSLQAEIEARTVDRERLRAKESQPAGRDCCS